MRIFATRAFSHAGMVAIVLAVAACSGKAGGGSSYGTGDPSLAAANPGGGAINPFLADGSAVLRALDAISARSGQPLRVTSMTADRVNGLTVDVQEPSHHVNVDQYAIAIDGTLTGPTPVKLMSETGGPVTAADVDRKAFDPRAVGFGRLAPIVREAIAKSKFDDARASEWDFDGIGPDDRRYIYLEAARGRPAAIIDPHLKITGKSF